MVLTEYVSSTRVQVKSAGFGKPKKNGAPAKRTMRLQLPGDIADRLGDRIEGVSFEVELNDDGILFRPSNGHTTSAALPSWVPAKVAALNGGSSVKK